MLSRSQRNELFTTPAKKRRSSARASVHASLVAHVTGRRRTPVENSGGPVLFELSCFENGPPFREPEGRVSYRWDSLPYFIALLKEKRLDDGIRVIHSGYYQVRGPGGRILRDRVDAEPAAVRGCPRGGDPRGRRASGGDRSDAVGSVAVGSANEDSGRSRPGVLPNLIVIGAMKCGTTALHRYLDLHPEVAMSEPKELNFFFGPERLDERDEPAARSAGNWHRGVGWYAMQFRPAPVRGEASPGYTSPSFPEAAERMARVVPEARLVYAVRDPVARAVSQYLHHRADGTERRPIEEALLDPASQYLARSLYHERLESTWRASRASGSSSARRRTSRRTGGRPCAPSTASRAWTTRSGRWSTIVSGTCPAAGRRYRSANRCAGASPRDCRTTPPVSGSWRDGSSRVGNSEERR